MVEYNCLYLKNLPRRPRSNANFTRLLLNHINPHNKFAIDPSLPLPANETFGNGPLRLLDETLGIIQISRSVRLENQCFITFIDHESANSFKSRFEHDWKVKGRLIEVQFATKNSLMGLAVTDQDLLHHVLKKRQMQRRIDSNEDLKESRRLQRRLRRLRCKLRKKGLSAEEIGKVTETVKDQRPQVSEPRKKQTGEKPVVLRENPPNKVLLVQNLPRDTTVSAITELFRSAALLEVRLVAVRRLAFVEYESIEAAAATRDKLGASHSWNGHQINIEFAK
ncbi:hypothetical protein HG536_0B02010 [Torulaspora globosa]|uniref:RRM domain-containing protein n=1 Tax=Torulaspora globosa TaxID=48254 RepID=A0A7G3ZCV2_9SACH|nr:uncharacterized protein HG536_0B02010 [Torulaspora globosa]QLL31338.1 hypothetical protein HG536_0B02010 [Torulaspora globosa]